MSKLTTLEATELSGRRSIQFKDQGLFAASKEFEVEVWEEEGGSLSTSLFPSKNESIAQDDDRVSSSAHPDLESDTGGPTNSQGLGLRQRLSRSGYSLEEQYFYEKNRELQDRVRSRSGAELASHGTKK